MSKLFPLYSVLLPIIIGMTGTAILVFYISHWTVIFPDSATYLHMAGEIQKGKWHIDQWGRGSYSGPPLYPMLVALAEWIISGFDRAGKIVAVVAASAAIIPLFFLARQSYGDKAGLAVIPLVVLNPLYLQYVSQALTESLFTFLFLAGIVLTLYALAKNSPILWFTVGIMAGSAWMTRDAGIIVPFISFLWLAVGMWKKRCLPSDIVRNSVALLLGIILIYAPLKIVMTMDQKGMSNLPKTSIAFNLIMPDLRNIMEREMYTAKLNENSTEYALTEAQRVPPKLSDTLQHWKLILQRFGVNIGAMIESIYDILGLTAVLFVLIGISGGKYLFIGSYIIIYFIFYAAAGGFTGALSPERYLVPIIPLLGIWVVAGILIAGKFIRKFKIKHLEKAIMLLCFGIIISIYFQDIMQLKIIFQQKLNKVEFYKQLGERIRQASHSHGMEEISVMTRSPYLSYYSGASFVLLPYGEYPEVLNFAKQKGVDFLFMDKGMIPQRPQLSFLLNPNTSLPELERVFYTHSREDNNKLLAVLYKIK